MSRFGLSKRLSLAILLAALVVGVISAKVFYRITFNDELTSANREISQLFTTVSSTASIAAYVEDVEIAREVVNGLTTNNIVHGAKFKAGKLETSTDIRANSKPLIFQIVHPFNPSTEIGELLIFPEVDYITARAEAIGLDNVKALLFLAIVITISTLLISHYLIIRPMVNAGKHLNTIDPGSPNRLIVPDFHQSTELGQLVFDINDLLAKSEQQINQERHLRKEIETLEKNFRMIFENSVSPIVLIDTIGEIILSNRAFNHFIKGLNQKSQNNYGCFLSQLFIHPNQIVEQIEQAFAEDNIAIGEYQIKTDSEVIWYQVISNPISVIDDVALFQMTLHDISQQKRKMEKLSMQAEVDGLTGLTNRYGAEKQLSDLVEREVPFALVLVDLNGFKQINDVYGHDIGDLVLQHVAEQMKHSSRQDDIVSRWGGDEFVITFKRANKKVVKTIIEKMLAKIMQPVEIENSMDKPTEGQVSVGASFGAAFFTSSDTSLQSVIRRADKAMYKAKALKQSSPEDFLFFDDDTEKD
jgi:diguanylate cyclase (GGDEF)-like protein/PAS domain S-box-containing protein